MFNIEKDLKDTLSMKETDISDKSADQPNKYEKNISTNYEYLSIIFTIYKYLVSISDQTTLEYLMADEMYMITFGALEYDLDSISSQKLIRHRSYFKEKSNFKNTFKIEDGKIIEKIHLNHRLTYLKDIAIGRFIEDGTMKCITVLCNSNYAEIINYIISNKYVLKNVSEKLNSSVFQDKAEAIDFLVEIITIGKEM